MDNSKINIACVCCENLTMEQDSRYDICPVCYWESDPIQNDDENYEGGANKISLKHAKLNYKNLGAILLENKVHVRLPLSSEIPNITG